MYTPQKVLLNNLTGLRSMVTIKKKEVGLLGPEYNYKQNFFLSMCSMYSSRDNKPHTDLYSYLFSCC